MNQINKKHVYSRQKRRSFSMLVVAKEIYKVNRKRKKVYIPYEVNKFEVKEYQKIDQSQWMMKVVMIVIKYEMNVDRAK